MFELEYCKSFKYNNMQFNIYVGLIGIFNGLHISLRMNFDRTMPIFSRTTATVYKTRNKIGTCSTNRYPKSVTKLTVSEVVSPSHIRTYVRFRQTLEKYLVAVNFVQLHFWKVYIYNCFYHPHKIVKVQAKKILAFPIPKNWICE